MVLLVVDCQKALVTDHLLRSKLFIQNVKDMIAAARKNHVEVIYVIHDDGEGHELSHGMPGLRFMMNSDRKMNVRDYMLTKDNKKERFEQIHRTYPELNMDIVIPHEEYMDKFIDMFRKEYQTAENYLLKIGLSYSEVKKIKGKLITAQE